MTKKERQSDWRWIYVQEMVSANKRLTKTLKQDTSLTEAHMFYKALVKAQAEPFPIGAFMALEKDYPDMVSAHGLATEPELERFFVEAMVVAGTSKTVISKKTGYSKKTIQYFEDVFFDIRRHLDKPVFIMGTILGPLFAQSSAVHHDHFWKAVGYFCGQEALDALWDMGKGSDESAEKLTKILSGSLLSQATYASMARKPGSSNAGFVIESYTNNEHLNIAKRVADTAEEVVRDTDDPLALIHSDVLDYMRLSVKHPKAEHTSVEEQLADVDKKVNRQDYEKPKGFS